MKIIISYKARNDLFEIGDYIAKDNPVRAHSFVEEIICAVKQIGEMPLAYPIIPRYKKIKLRRKIFGNYLIFYYIENEEIYLVHILHGARDIDEFLD